MRRYNELDALRGIAALSVLLLHLWLASPAAWSLGHLSAHTVFAHPVGVFIKYGPGRILIAGASAVPFFFVLSGFVLSLSLDRATTTPWLGYAVKRVFRLMPTVVATTLLAAVSYSLTADGHLVGVSEWLKTQWPGTPTVWLAVQHIGLLGSKRALSLDPPMWSLVVEMRVSLLFPLIYYCCTRRPTFSIVIAASIYAASSVFMSYAGQTEATSILSSIAITGEFLPFFVAGSLLYIYREILRRLYSTMSVAARRLLLVPILFAACLPNWGPIGSTSLAGRFGWMLILGAAAGAAIIAAIESVCWQRLLLHPMLQWLGRISYTLYLSHWIILLTVLRSLSWCVPVPILLAAVVPLSMIASHLLSMWVERPGIELGRRLQAWMAAFRSPRAA